MPVITATDERSISIMRRAKTIGRSTKSTEGLSSLAALHCNKQLEN